MEREGRSGDGQRSHRRSPHHRDQDARGGRHDRQYDDRSYSRGYGREQPPRHSPSGSWGSERHQSPYNNHNNQRGHGYHQNQQRHHHHQQYNNQQQYHQRGSSGSYSRGRGYSRVNSGSGGYNNAGHMDRRRHRQYTPEERRRAEERALVGFPPLFDKFIKLRFNTFHEITEADLFLTCEAPILKEMSELKEQAGIVRSKLDHKALDSWKALTRFTNPTGRVIGDLKRKLNAELCTNAWAKMFEILVHYKLFDNIVRSGRRAIRSVHACEAPGGFITATNHYLVTKLGVTQKEWKWVGNSLNPYHEQNDPTEMVDSDDFIRETFANWYFGLDDTGDIRNRDNIRGLWKRAHAMVPRDDDGSSSSSSDGGGVDLFTADGSIDCQFDPNEQERIVAQLHFCEMVAGLGCLGKGGSMVLKMFTLFEHPTISLLYLLGSLFEELHVTKPACSRASNAETYIVAIGFKGISDPVLEKLLANCGVNAPVDDEGFTLNLLETSKLPQPFISEVIQIAGKFSNWFTECIERNLALDEKKSALEDQLINKAKYQVVETYHRKYAPVPLMDRDKMVPHRTLNPYNTSFYAKKAPRSTATSSDGGTTLDDRQRIHNEHIKHKEKAFSQAPAARSDGGTSTPMMVYTPKIRGSATSLSPSTTAEPPPQLTLSPPKLSTSAKTKHSGGDDEDEGSNGSDGDSLRARKRAKVIVDATRAHTQPMAMPSATTTAATATTATSSSPSSSTPSATGDEETKSTLPVAPGTAPAELCEKPPSLGERLLQKAGHTQGPLGKNSHGLAAPIEVVQRPSGVGLGLGDYDMEDATAGLLGAPYFEDRDGPQSDEWLKNIAHNPARKGGDKGAGHLTSSNPLQPPERSAGYGSFFVRSNDTTTLVPPLTKEDTSSWTVAPVRPLLTILSSKFCRQKLIVQLQEQRRDNLKAVVPLLASAKHAKAFLAAGIVAPAMVVALKKRLNLSARGEPVADSVYFNFVEIANTLLMAKLVGSSTTSPESKPAIAKCAILHPSLSEYAAYLQLHCQELWRPLVHSDSVFLRQDACIHHTLPSGPGPLCEAALAPMSTSAADGAQECNDALPRGQADVAIAGVKLDVETQVCGIQNDVTDRHYKLDLIDQCIAALSTLTPDGVLILVVTDILTRFIANTCYILYRSFSEMRIAKPFGSHPALPHRFLIFRSYLGAEKCVAAIDHFKEVLRTLQRTLHEDDQLGLEGFQEGAVDVLSFVPTPAILTQTNFLASATVGAERLTQREAAAIAAVQRVAAHSHETEGQDEDDPDTSKAGEEALVRIFGSLTSF